MSFLPSMPGAGLMEMFQRFPELAVPLHEFAESLMRGPSQLSPEERELIAAYVSRLNGCAFCTQAHGEVLRRLGGDPEPVEALVADLEGAPVDPRLKALLHYVRRVNDDPHHVGQADVEAVLAAGWDEAALVYANVVCGFFNLMNRWVDGTGIPADPGAVDRAGRFLHDQGYAGVGRVLAAGSSRAAG